MSDTPNESLLRRIADALDRINRPATVLPDYSAATAYVWHADETRLEPVPKINRVPIALLKGIDQARDTLLAGEAAEEGGIRALKLQAVNKEGNAKSQALSTLETDIEARQAAGTLAEQLSREFPYMEAAPDDRH